MTVKLRRGCTTIGMVVSICQLVSRSCVPLHTSCPHCVRGSSDSVMSSFLPLPATLFRQCPVRSHHLLVVTLCPVPSSATAPLPGPSGRAPPSAPSVPVQPFTVAALPAGPSEPAIPLSVAAPPPSPSDPTNPFSVGAPTDPQVPREAIVATNAFVALHPGRSPAPPRWWWWTFPRSWTSSHTVP